MSDFVTLSILAFLLLSMFLSLVFIAYRRQLFDLVLAVNLFGTLAVGLVCAIGLLLGNDYFVDIALLYALINFIAAIALLRLFNRENRTWLDFSQRRDP